MVNPMDLSSKHILITGGSSGIGRASAIQASKLGAKVTLIARNENNLKETILMMDDIDKHAFYCADLNDVANIENLIKKIKEERGDIDGVCHAAGIADVRPLKLTKTKFLQKMLNIHVFAFVELVRCLLLNNAIKIGGSIVGISSYASNNGGVAQGAYSAAKAAIDGFIVPASKELASGKIRINNVAFAMVNTQMYDDFLDSGGTVESTERQLLGIIDVESAANVITFLLSDATKHITGSVIPVYAGY